ncbi:hypothetical protein JCM11251_004050 [Rhodosporidiobolus azoricus]
MSAPPVDGQMKEMEGAVEHIAKDTPVAVEAGAAETKATTAGGEEAKEESKGNGIEQASSASNGTALATEPSEEPVASVQGTEKPHEKGASTAGDIAMQDAPSDSPREGTPAVSEADSDATSVATSSAPAAAATTSASMEPTGTSDGLPFPLSAYTFANTTLVPIASTSTTPFFFQNFPPQELEECWTRSKRSDDPEAYEPPDREPGYFATPEEMEASKVREAARQKRVQARLMKLNMLKGKQREDGSAAGTPPPPDGPPVEKRLTGRAAMKAKAERERAAAAAGEPVPLGPRRGRPPKGAPTVPKPKKETAAARRAREAKEAKEAQEEVREVEKQERSPSPMPVEEVKPFTTRYNCKLVESLLPDDAQTATPIYLEPHPAFIDLFDVPPHYMPDGPIQPAPAKPLPELAAAPTPAAAPVQAVQQAHEAPAAPTPAQVSDEPMEDAKPSFTTSTTAKRARSTEDEGKRGGRKKARESSTISAKSVTPAPALAPAPADPSSAPAADEAAFGSRINYVVQSTSCLSKKVDGQIRCFQCISRAIGHVCSFQGIRSFGVDQQGQIVTPPVFKPITAPDDEPRFERQLTRAYNTHDTELLKTWLAPEVTRMLRREVQAASDPNTIKIRHDIQRDPICDTCNTAQVGAHWLCTNCGRVACQLCFDKLTLLEETEKSTGAFPSTADTSRRRKCVAKKRGKAATDAEEHRIEHFVHLTPFYKDDLAAMHKEAADWHAGRMLAKTDPKTVSYLRRKFNIPSPLAQYDANTHKINSVQHAQLTEPIFFELWRMGEPVIVKKVPLEGMSKFDPGYFAQKCENWQVDLVNNYGTETMPSNGGQFFKAFNVGAFRREDDGKSSFRAKDFPSPKAFGVDLKEVEEEFYKTLPLKNILLPNGIYNMIAHSPANAYQPYVGPRMTASWETNAKWGTTQLQTHCTDTAAFIFWGGKDAKTDKPLRVRWDIFRTEDIDKLREYCWELLCRKLPKNTTAAKFRETHDDPLLSPCLYLTKSQRLELFTKYGVKPYPLYQFEGDLVLVPAGCPFQVSSWIDHLTLSLSFLGGARTNYAIGVSKGMQHQTKDRQLWRQDNVHLESQLLWTWKASDEFDKAEKIRLATEAANAPARPSVLEPVPAGADTGAEAAATAAAAAVMPVPSAVPATPALPPLPPVHADGFPAHPAVPGAPPADPPPAEGERSFVNGSFPTSGTATSTMSLL